MKHSNSIFVTVKTLGGIICLVFAVAIGLFSSLMTHFALHDSGSTIAMGIFMGILSYAINISFVHVIRTSPGVKASDLIYPDRHADKDVT